MLHFLSAQIFWFVCWALQPRCWWLSEDLEYDISSFVRFWWNEMRRHWYCFRPSFLSLFGVRIKTLNYRTVTRVICFITNEIRTSLRRIYIRVCVCVCSCINISYIYWTEITQTKVKLFFVLLNKNLNPKSGKEVFQCIKALFLYGKWISF